MTGERETEGGTNMEAIAAALTLEELLFMESDEEEKDVMEGEVAVEERGDVWGRQEDDRKKKNKKKNRQSEELRRLREAAEEMEARLLQHRSGSEWIGEWWDAITERQRAERGRAVQENALLRDAVKKQTRVAIRIAGSVHEKVARLRKMHAGAGLARTAVRATKVRQVPMAPRFNSMAWMLHKRMDELHEKVLTEAVGPHVVYEKRSVVPYEHGGFRLIHSQGRFIPFKLSIVATQTWETVIDALHEQCHLFDTVETSCDVVQSAMWSRAELESGVMETQGGVVMRRVYEEDGSVLFLMATMLLPCGGIGSGDTRQRNLVDRLSLEESSWCRVRRHVDAHTSGVLVHIEGSYSQEVKPLDMNVERGRLEALRDFMHELIDQDMPKNRQRLENRLLDATLAMERCKRMRTM